MKWFSILAWTLGLVLGVACQQEKAKIDSATLSLADGTFVTGQNNLRKSPNPNVLIELGYAASKLSWDNIICILNLAFGQIEELPFDLRSRRILTYHLIPNSEKKAVVKKELVNKLTYAIKFFWE
ncbi:MAG: hypothetical protein IPL28_19120 [Chloroflexi bacterium]|nr:hypothetical protein [Chloroflexota bacterium]